MRHLKRIFATLMTLSLILSVTSSSFAAAGDPATEPLEPEETVVEIETDITMLGTGTEWSAWRLLDLTTALRDPECHAGEGADVHSEDCWSFAYSVNDAYRAELVDVLGLEDETVTDDNRAAVDRKIIDAIAEMQDDGDEIRAFADAMYAKLKNKKADETAENNVFEGAKQGYYLIAETGVVADEDSRSLVMLDTKGQEDIVVEAKEDTPKLEKKILEKNDAKAEDADGNNVWQDAADYDVGDEIAFRLTATMPGNIDGYTKYRIVFRDTLSEGLTLKPDSVEVTVFDSAEDAERERNGRTLVADADYVITTPTDVAGGKTSLSVAIQDLFRIPSLSGDDSTFELTAKTVVVVKYKATLNENAIIGGAGNKNGATLEFSNDPYDQSETGTTPPDIVTAFTFSLNVNKVGGTRENFEPLDGAEFTLYKYDPATGEYELYDTLKVEDGTVRPERGARFEFAGLDSGLYRLAETVVPNGYTGVDPIYFEIRATYTTSGEIQKLENLEIYVDGRLVSGRNGETTGEGAEWTVDLARGEVETNVLNVPGVKLPVTGGYGRTATHVAGLATVAIGFAAAAYAIKRRRDA